MPIITGWGDLITYTYDKPIITMRTTNNKYALYFLVLVLTSPIVSGCLYPSDPIKPTEIEYSCFIRVDSLYPHVTLRKGDNLCFNVGSYHKVAEDEIFSFYDKSAKSFIAEDYEYFLYHYHWPLTIAGIDWRVTRIDAFTVDDWDENHPAGSLINDLISVNYMFQNEWRFIPLSDFKYGDLMMSDYGLTFIEADQEQWICNCCLAFSLTEYPPVNSQGVNVITVGIGSRRVRFEMYDVWGNVLRFDNYSTPASDISVYNNDLQ